MFDVGWSELLLIGIVALIAIGPKELPGALRTLGQWMGKVRRMASEFQSQFHEAMREAELAELKKEVDEMANKASSYTNFDPVSEITKDLEKAAGPLPSLDGSPTDTPPAAASTTDASPASPPVDVQSSSSEPPAAPPSEGSTVADTAATPPAPPASEPPLPSTGPSTADAGQKEPGRAA